MSTQIAGGLPGTLRNLHTGVALYHPGTGRILDANERLLALFGYSLDQLRSMSVDEYSANTSSLSESDIVSRIRAAANDDPQKFRWRIKRADGDLRWMQVSLSSIRLGDRQYVLAEVTDVTSNIYDNRRVRLLTRILRHNLRNDTNVISGYADEIRSGAVEDSVREYAERINDKALELGRLSERVGQIEQVVSADYGTPTRRRASDVVHAVVEEKRRDYPRVTFTVEEHTEMWVRVDEAFRVGLAHAIENGAVHNTGDDQHVEVCVDESPNTGRTEVRIHDDGPPIPDIEVNALDESKSFSGTDHGSGVGLFVMKWCIESLGGELCIERDSGNNVVSFYLPPKTPPES